MKIINGLFVVAGIICVMEACGSVKKKGPLEDEFSMGKIKIQHQKKAIGENQEINLATRFEFAKRGMGTELSQYFQYQLGKKIKLVIENDTIEPVLAFYVPLLSEMQKQINSTFVVSTMEINKTKMMIIEDSILDFNKVKISFK